MTSQELQQKLDNYMKNLKLEELEEKIAPVDCQKKPDHPDCQPTTKYGGPQPLYGVVRYGGPTP